MIAERSELEETGRAGVARAVGISTVKYADLSSAREQAPTSSSREAVNTHGALDRGQTPPAIDSPRRSPRVVPKRSIMSITRPITKRYRERCGGHVTAAQSHKDDDNTSRTTVYGGWS
ncbi:hypothetical protein GCM10017691_07990 [Pseudonocardia petroleophila]